MIRRLQLRDQSIGDVAETRAAWQALAEPLALVAVRSLAALVWSTVESALHCSGHRCVIHGCRCPLARHRSMNRWSSLRQLRLSLSQRIRQGLRSEPSR
jgi:hypothetical protein